MKNCHLIRLTPQTLAGLQLQAFIKPTEKLTFGDLHNFHIKNNQLEDIKTLETICTNRNKGKSY